MKILSKRKRTDILVQIMALAIGFIIIIPIIYAFCMSFMTEKELYKVPLSFFPESFYWQNYVTAWTTTLIGRFLLNSLIVSLVSSILRLVVASTAAYSFTFFEFKGKKLLFYLMLSSMVMPADVLVLANYKTVTDIGLSNTYAGIIVMFIASANNVFIMRQHFLSFSKSVYEAAKIDGCGSFRFYSSILVPISRPIFVTVFISTFIGTWNQYVWPMIITTTDEMRTVQVGVKLFKSVEGNNYGPLMAVAMIALFPTILIFVIFQKKITSGLTSGAVKE